jgi:hypothetical protein
MRRPLKHRLMRAIHRRLERWTVPAADGLMAVSRSYIDLLCAAYPALRDRPAAVSPFPYSAADFIAANAYGKSLAGLRRTDGGHSCLYAGRIAPAMEPSLRACFALVAAGRARCPEVFDRLWFVFVGTGYAASDNPSVAMRLARETGMADRVVEHPDRVSFLDAQKSMLVADMLLVIGSDDDGYTPSKLNQTLFLPKPVLCAAPRASGAARAVEGLATVPQVVVGEPVTDELIDGLANQLKELLSHRAQGVYEERESRTRPFEAVEAARRDCGLFDRVVERSGTARQT